MSNLAFRASDASINDLCVRKSIGSTTGQFTVENGPGYIADWDREYVNFGGFFGTHGPYLFAAAPDIAAALKQCHDIMHECTAVLSASDCAKVAKVMAVARAALAKSRGEA